MGETDEDSLKRELEEELGVRNLDFRRLADQRYDDPSMADVEMSVFLVTDWSPEPANLATEEHDELRWFTVAEASDMPLATQTYLSLFRRVETLVGATA